MTISHAAGRPAADDRGSAIIIALLATVLLTTLGLGLVMLSSTEGAIASNYRQGHEALYAADGAIERVVQDVLLVPRWNDILNGTVQSAFVDNTLTPTLPLGGTINLTSLTAEMQSQSNATSPWGPNNPVWHLFAYGPLSNIGGTAVSKSPMYMAVWIADDPAETDGDPSADANGVITVLAQAIGPAGAIRTIEATVSKTDTTEIERGLIAQRGQEELNQRARKAAVQLPGKTLSAMDLSVTTGGMTVR
jgi:hypothetical protein